MYGYFQNIACWQLLSPFLLLKDWRHATLQMNPVPKTCSWKEDGSKQLSLISAIPCCLLTCDHHFEMPTKKSNSFLNSVLPSELWAYLKSIILDHRLVDSDFWVDSTTHLLYPEVIYLYISINTTCTVYQRIMYGWHGWITAIISTQSIP